MPGLHRYYGAGHLHSITTSCYHRRPWLAREPNRDLFVEVLEQVRRRYHFVMVGYVVMPEHLHLLLSEPERGDPSTVMQAIKQGFARRLLGRMRRSRDPRQSDLWNGSLSLQPGFDRAANNKAHMAGSIAAHPCKKRKDGAPTFAMAHTESVSVRQGTPAE